MDDFIVVGAGMACAAVAYELARSALLENPDARVELWVGGDVALDQHKIAGMRHVTHLTEIPEALARWRANPEAATRAARITEQ
jgi:glycine/D-amino acid oxidase-like deaminating enzyme